MRSLNAFILTCDREVNVNVTFGRLIFETDSGQVLVVGLAKVERELIING